MDITNVLIEAVLNKTPISFCKYGDGEYFCATSRYGRNCDNDTYTDKLKHGLNSSFVYMATNHPNSYIGLWFTNEVKVYWEGLTSSKINWANYQSLFLCDESVDLKVQLYKTIRNSSLNKIIVCNKLLVKCKILFNIDNMVNVQFNNWFDTDLDSILDSVKKCIEPNSQNIIITCAGMGAKVLICELYKSFPNNIYLDFGSALDKICTKKDSRGWEPSYEELTHLLKDIMPNNWEDSKYEYIYETAKHTLGLHL